MLLVVDFPYCTMSGWWGANKQVTIMHVEKTKTKTNRCTANAWVWSFALLFSRAARRVPRDIELDAESF